MSYCRWSTDNFKCQLYVYQHVDGGWAIHVANYKVVGDVPDDGWEDFIKEGIDTDEFLLRHKRQMEFMETAKREPIGLPYDGDDFYPQTKEETIEILTMLKSAGYVFPYEIIEEIETEVDGDSGAL